MKYIMLYSISLPFHLAESVEMQRTRWSEDEFKRQVEKI